MFLMFCLQSVALHLFVKTQEFSSVQFQQFRSFDCGSNFSNIQLDKSFKTDSFTFFRHVSFNSVMKKKNSFKVFCMTQNSSLFYFSFWILKSIIRQFRCYDRSVNLLINIIRQIQPHEQIEFWSHDRKFDLLKKLNFDLMKLDLMIISLVTYVLLQL